MNLFKFRVSENRDFVLIFIKSQSRKGLVRLGWRAWESCIEVPCPSGTEALIFLKWHEIVETHPGLVPNRQLKEQKILAYIGDHPNWMHSLRKEMEFWIWKIKNTFFVGRGRRSNFVCSGRRGKDNLTEIKFLTFARIKSHNKIKFGCNEVTVPES